MKRTIEINRIGIIFKSDFKKRLKVNIIWIISTVALMFLYLALYPVMEELIIEKLALMPDEILSILGADSALSISDFTSYFGMIFSVFAVVFAIYSSLLGSDVIYDEEKDGTIEFLYAQEVSRWEIYLGKMLNLIINVITIILCSYLTIIICGYAVIGSSFNGVNILKIVGLNLIVFLFFGALGLFLSTILNKRIKPSSITLGIFFGTYLLGYLGNLLKDKINFLQYFSPIYVTNASTILNSNWCNGNTYYNPLGIIIILILTIILFIVGGLAYSRRDIL